MFLKQLDVNSEYKTTHIRIDCTWVENLGFSFPGMCLKSFYERYSAKYIVKMWRIVENGMQMRFIQLLAFNVVIMKIWSISDRRGLMSMRLTSCEKLKLKKFERKCIN